MSGDAPEAEFWCSLCKAFGHDDIACDDVPQPVPWWWTDEGRSAHDAAIRAEALRDATGALTVFRAEAWDEGFEHARSSAWHAPDDNPYRAAQPTEVPS